MEPDAAPAEPSPSKQEAAAPATTPPKPAIDDAARARAAANKAAALEKLAAKKRRAAEAAEAEAKRRRTEGPGCAGCEVCGGGPLDATLERVFAVRVCAEHKARSSYDLVPSGDAAATYLLPKNTLKCLASVERSNPRQPTWRPMKLYLRRDLEVQADRRWGDAEKLDEERRRREAAKLAKSEKSARSFFKKS